MALVKNRSTMLATAAVGAALVLTSCTCTIKEDQQAMINKMRSDEQQLLADISKAESDKSRISSELNSRQAEVRSCTERKTFVQDKMAQWPNIWPDYQKPEPSEDGVKESTTKKKR